jgi:NADH dehydrogenase FAD-containing subunit
VAPEPDVGLNAASGPDAITHATLMQVRGFEYVYALGDIGGIDINRAGVAARQAPVVAANIKARISGSEERATYTPGPPVIVLPWDLPGVRASCLVKKILQPPNSPPRSRAET